MAPPRPASGRLAWALLVCVLLIGAAFDAAASSAGLSIRARRALHGVSEERGRLLQAGQADAAQAPSPSPSSDAVDSQSVLNANKGGAMALFLAVPLIGCFLPWVLPIPFWILNYAVLFAAGLFFTLAIEHLLSDAAGFEKFQSQTYPYPYMIFVCGYFLTWLADITTRAIWERNAESKADRAEQAALVSPSPPKAQITCCKSGRVQEVSLPAAVAAEAGQNGAGSNGADAGAAKAVDAAPVMGDGAMNGNGDAEVAACKCDGANCKCDGSGTCKCSTPSWMEFDTPENIAKSGSATLFDLNLMEMLLLLLALCFHAIFEGLAVGLSATVADVWSTTLAVVIHKFLEGIALGTTLLAQNRNRSFLSFFLYALAFSIMVPVGIAIGMILNTTTPSETAAWVEAIGNALAAGVFVFVAVAHLMVKAMKPQPGDRWWSPFPKWAFAALGVVASSLLQMLAS